MPRCRSSSSARLGRGSTVSLRIVHEHLSREHARVEVGDLVALEDLGQGVAPGLALDLSFQIITIGHGFIHLCGPSPTGA